MIISGDFRIKSSDDVGYFFQHLIIKNQFDHLSIVGINVRRVVRELFSSGEASPFGLHQKNMVSVAICSSILDAMVYFDLCAKCESNYKVTEKFEKWFVANRGLIFNNRIDLIDLFSFQSAVLIDEPDFMKDVVDIIAEACDDGDVTVSSDPD